MPDISLFYTRNAPRGIQDGILLEFVTFIDYGGKLFIKGRIPSTDEKGTDWVSNLQAGMAWEDVTHFMIFDSRDDYIDRMGNAKVPFFRKLTGKFTKRNRILLHNKSLNLTRKIIRFYVKASANLKVWRPVG